MARRSLSLSLLLGILTAGSQPLFGQGITLGLKGGVNVGNIDSDDVELLDTKSRTGFVGGGFLSIGLGDVLVLQPEFLFSQKGFTLEEDADKLTGEFDYFALPVLVKVMFPIESSSVRPGIYAGGVVSFESSCNIAGDVDGVAVSEECDTPGGDFEFSHETTDYGLVFGAEVQVDVGGLILLADGRYDIGLRDIDTDEESVSVKSRTWSFMAGVGFKP